MCIKATFESYRFALHNRVRNGDRHHRVIGESTSFAKQRELFRFYVVKLIDRAYDVADYRSDNAAPFNKL